MARLLLLFVLYLLARGRLPGYLALAWNTFAGDAMTQDDADMGAAMLKGMAGE